MGVIRVYGIPVGWLIHGRRRDMPPPGGFEAVKYKRNLPFRGPSGLVILGAVTAVCAYGFYRVGKGNLERRYVPNTDKVDQQAVKRVFSWCARHETCPCEDPAAVLISTALPFRPVPEKAN